MPHDPKKIVHSALAFRLAAHRSLEPRPVSRSMHEFEILMIPAIVCKAFSLELFLKAILASFHIQGRGHSLISLYQQTPNEIKVEFQKISGMSEKILSDKFTQLADVFTDWRYVYEVSAIQLESQALDSLLEAAYQIACQRIT